jgi:hypothetical protein
MFMVDTKSYHLQVLQSEPPRLAPYHMQVTMHVLVRTMEHVMECYPANPIGWGHVIELLQMLVTEDNLLRALNDTAIAIVCISNAPKITSSTRNGKKHWRKQVPYDPLWGKWAV